MKNRWARRRPGPSLDGTWGAWGLLVLVIVGVPVTAFLLFRLKLETYCPPSEKWAGCDYTRLILLVLAALGTAALLILLWWGISKLAGLRGIFEYPGSVSARTSKAPACWRACCGPPYLLSPCG